MHWFSSTQEGNASSFEWPPKFQSFDEYKAELNEAVATHPPFGVWLRTYRNVKHVGGNSVGDPMWQLSVQELKERYVTCTTLNNRRRNAKRVFIELHLEDNHNLYADEERDFEKRQESYALAIDAYKQAHKHGYRNVPPPNKPHKSQKLLERDDLIAELKHLTDELP